MGRPVWFDRVVIDVETSVIPGIQDYFDDIRAPRNYKDKEKIEAYKREAEQRQVDDAALDIDLLRIIAIAWRQPGMPVPLGLVARDEEEETKILKAFWKRMKSQASGWKIFIGANILDFDLPALLRRSLYLNIPAPDIALDRYRHPNVVDLQQELSWNGKVKYRSKDFYCRRFGIKVDDPYTGGDVMRLVAEKDYDAILRHCKCDVEKEYYLAKRIGLLEDAPDAGALLSAR